MAITMGLLILDINDYENYYIRDRIENGKAYFKECSSKDEVFVDLNLGNGFDEKIHYIKTKNDGKVAYLADNTKNIIREIKSEVPNGVFVSTLINKI